MYTFLEVVTPTVGSMEAVIKATADLFGLVGTVITAITAQPILLAFLATSFVGIGIGIFKSLKGAARR